MSLQIIRSVGKRSTLTGIKALSARFSHKLAKPINPPPNDHLAFKVVTLEDLPKPDLDYYADYKKNNIKYWRHLIMGLSFLSGTLYYIIVHGDIMWNYYPPVMPPKEERITSFWDESWDEEDDDDDD